MHDHEHDFWLAVEAVRARDPRYRREAYAFLMGALGFTVQSLPAERRADPERRHLSGAELLQGMIELARREFGVLAPTVFREWGVTCGEDVGAMVFQLVEARQLSARPEDRIEDFAGVTDLLERLGDGAPTGPGPSRS
jgi:uncharacterized repeat protein (TIGR04138 family)